MSSLFCDEYYLSEHYRFFYFDTFNRRRAAKPPLQRKPIGGERRCQRRWVKKGVTYMGFRLCVANCTGLFSIIDKAFRYSIKLIDCLRLILFLYLSLIFKGSILLNSKNYLFIIISFYK
jgi:hypothetical protein